MSLLYDCALAILLLGLGLRRKKEPIIKARFSLSPPDPKGRPVIWIHAVSVGEVKAAAPLYRKIKEAYPTHFLLITTTTATGQQEAQRSLPQADAYRFLPFDFSWIMKRWTRTVRPERLIFVESDFWYHLIHYAKKEGAQITLVSGKLSARSAKRFQFFSLFSKKLFSHFDLLCVQNEEHRSRFAPLVSSPLMIGGNLKLDMEPQSIPKETKWGIGPWLTLASTHDLEEQVLISALKPLLKVTKIFLAPRHPERTKAVATLLEKMEVPFCLYSKPEDNVSIVLVDALGHLPACYAMSFASLVCGSFVPAIGGHNLIEPLLYDCPSFYGPYTDAQKEFAQLVEKRGAGKSLKLEQLESTLSQLLQDPSLRARYVIEGRALIEDSKGAALRTFDLLIRGVHS